MIIIEEKVKELVRNRYAIVVKTSSNAKKGNYMNVEFRLGEIEDDKSMMLRLYEWFHKKWPKYIDCRPIYVEPSLRDAGYEIRKREKVKLFDYAEYF